MPVTKILIASRGHLDPSAIKRSEGSGAKRSGTGPRPDQRSSTIAQR